MPQQLTKHTKPKAAARQPWQATVVTLLPECFPGPLGASLSGQALSTGLWLLDTVALRDFGIGKHASVDDTPAGGGAGMVLRADVVGPAIEAAIASNQSAPLVYLSPRGTPLTQTKVRSLAEGPGIILLAGRFEGVDQRVLDAFSIEEISVGDYVLSGGEIAAMTVLDACIRLLPGVVGASESLTEESFENNRLEYPHYTRPRSWQGRDIPDILLSGDHQRIAAWRQSQSLAITKARRRDLLDVSNTDGPKSQPRKSGK